ncbi:MAG TPA: bacillithiol biosynthesis cysteine-adding enzyme BshC [Pyrinomonadaceae bacterium]|nr:bacillithiol biosynthesis cysteine-adding enzyme BshC [Pyrinomonadaceae bacterium]
MSTTAEAACFSTPEEAGLRVENLPFERIPQQSRLFLDYLRDPVALRRFYPSAVRFHHELAERAPEVLGAYRTNRAELCDALEAMNTRWGATDETLGNIARLRTSDCVAVVSGQQAGLFTGPLYTIYKALSAVKLAGCLTQRGTPAVPVFWIATEDHDFPEVATAEFIGCDCRLASVHVSGEMHREGTPVGTVFLDESIEETVRRLLDVLPDTEFIPEVEKLLRETWEKGAGYGEAFARMMTRLLGRHGLILLDPLDAKLKQLASPLYADAARQAPEIAAALVARSRELEEAGYHAQVVISENTFPLFLHTGDGARHAVTRTDGGRYKLKDAREEYTTEELASMAANEPERFSPNVTLRAVVQDYLLPTVAYFGGAAEIAYFAQTAEVYRLLNRPATPILPRASLTIVERRTWRTLERYGLGLSDLFEGLDPVLARVVEEHLGTETAATFNRAEESINRELNQLQEQLREVDPTLAEALETGRRKIRYQLEGLRTRFHRAQMSRDRAAHRQLERAFAALYPNKTLQERHINITSLLARHGTYVVNWIYDAINLGTSDHQIVYL